ncbi:hypothetical protein BCON_0252g00070 [Botryotinia convoluta]|uniref:Uncharacterized protein n=1 Tax=Botryotinia convoluta TaxID=54673 RepID=A0A4Z1HGB8_9HELO|nr:hypothetical protein BCON_0252g00070 [Botryotinia convoluta]
MCKRASSNKDEEHRTVWCLDGQVTRNNHEHFNENNIGCTISDSFSNMCGCVREGAANGMQR